MLKRAVVYALLTSLGLVLLYYSLRDFDLTSLLSDLRHAHLLWFVSLIISVSCAYLVRAARWRQLLGASGYKIRFQDGLSALMTGYLVNVAVPRLGEIVRCIGLQRLAAVPVEVSVGTVVMERVIDMLMLFLIVISALIAFHNLLWQGVNVLIKELLSSFTYQSQNLGWLTILGSILLIALYLIYRNWNSWIIQRFQKMWKGFVLGLSSIGKLENKGAFVLATISIWLMYFYHTFVLTLIFDRFAGLGIKDALVIQASGSIAKLIPIQANGVGAYHFLVGRVTVLLGFSEGTAVAISIWNHGIQLIMAILLGLIGYSWYLILIWKKNQRREGVN